MRSKMKLDPTALLVDSFATLPNMVAERGTVMAFSTPLTVIEATATAAAITVGSPTGNAAAMEEGQADAEEVADEAVENEIEEAENDEAAAPKPKD